MKKLPLSTQSFVTLRTKDCYYVDKTPFIKSVMENDADVLLIARPRRFGKTLFMDTLRCFLRADCDPKITSELFKGLHILNDSAFCAEYCGQFPVVALSLADIEGTSFEEAYERFTANVCRIAKQYRYLLESDKLPADDKALFQCYLSESYIQNPANIGTVKDFLLNLTNLLTMHFERKVVLLIDEYDVPLDKAAHYGYYDKMLTLVRAFLRQVLKPDLGSPGNENLEKAVLTGCLRVGKESIFTGLNNPESNTVYSNDRAFNEILGFTTTEVDELLNYYGLAEHRDAVKTWYDGYRFGRSEIYCPWDVINFCKKARAWDDETPYVPENFWAGTSGNAVIDEFLGFLTGSDTEKMQTLVDGGTIDLTVNDKLSYRDLNTHTPSDFWTLLLYTGYLTVAERSPDSAYRFKVRIPNKEIRDTFEAHILARFSEANPIFTQHGVHFAKAALQGDTDTMTGILQTLLDNYVSVRDAATKAPAENYYHGFLTALLACAGNSIKVRSNAEAGRGFADLIITSGIGENAAGAVLELKRCSHPNHLFDTADQALEQIKAKHYAKVLYEYRCRRQFAYGLAFCGKDCAVTFEAIEPTTHRP